MPRCQQPICRAASAAICASSSARTGTAISAAAVGVGARRSAAKSISVMSVSWPTAEISGIMLAAAARTTISSLNDQQVFERAAAARHDDQIRPRQRAALGQRVEAFDGIGDLGGAIARPAPAPARPARGAESGRPAGAGCRGSPRRSARSPRRSPRARTAVSCLRASSNRPSAASFFLRSSSSFISAPMPAGSSVSMTIWYFDEPAKVVSLPVDDRRRAPPRA